jgi:hypothetical protein
MCLVIHSRVDYPLIKRRKLQKRNINDSAQLKITLAGVGGVKKTQLLIGGSWKE